jgi:hypothetical protein
VAAADQLVAPAFQNPPPTAYDPRGFAVGVLANDEITGRGVRLRQWRWRYGPEFREQPFLKHKALDGAFASLEGTVTGFYPDDHKGCRCSVAPVYVVEDTGRFVTEAELNRPASPQTFKEFTTRTEALKAITRYDEDFLIAVEGSLRDIVNARGRYFGTAYRTINAELRAGSITDLQVQEWVDALDEAATRWQFAEPTSLFRGVARDALPEVQDAFDAGTLVGAELSDAAYQSTTLLQSEAKRFARRRGALLFEIRASAGQPAIPGLRQEYEVILPRGSRLRVIEAEWTEVDGYPIRRIVAEIVG